jgi:large subunit ribosomal protein L4
MKATVYNTKGKEAGEIELPEALFAVKRNDVLLKQVLLAMQANARVSVAHTKGRGEVRGGGKKPWKQKGTGRARHGSIRSPIWRGGGTTHGPLSEKDYSQKINKKMRAKALAIALSEKLKSGRVLFVDSLSLSAPKSKEAKSILTGLSSVKGFDMLSNRRKNSALVLLGKKDEAAVKSFRNMGNVMIDEVRNTNPVDVMTYRYLVVVEPEASVKTLAARMK